MSVQGILTQARSQIGYTERPGNDTKFGIWYGMNFQPWCDIFMSWCAYMAGDLKIVGKFAFTPWHLDWFKNNGKYGQTPRPGALVFYKWPGVSSDECDHVGIVEAVHSNGTFTTIEGNVGNAVRRVVRSMKYVVGFGYPAYSNSPNPVPNPNPGPTPSPSGSPYPGHFTRKGDSGYWVSYIQSRLMRLGYSLGKYGVDGKFGGDTELAVKAFQKTNHLQEDGIVGPETWSKLPK